MVYDFTMEQGDYQAIDGLDQGARMYDPKYYKEYERDKYPYFDWGFKLKSQMNLFIK